MIVKLLQFQYLELMIKINFFFTYKALWGNLHLWAPRKNQSKDPPPLGLSRDGQA